MNENDQKWIHDLVNQLTCLEGKIRKLAKRHPEDDPKEWEKAHTYIKNCYELVAQFKKARDN